MSAPAMKYRSCGVRNDFTPEVRPRMEELGVKQNYLAWQGSQVIYLD